MPEVTHEQLCAVYARGREAWPSVELDLATFSALARERIAQHAGDELRADELYLAIACATGNERAIIAFDAHYLAGITPDLRRRGHNAATVADVIQMVRVRYLVGESGRPPEITRYDGRRSLATWLRVAATRTAISMYRSHRRETDEPAEPTAIQRSPELAVVHQRFGAAFEAEFRAAFCALCTRERTLLRYHFVDQLGIDRIAAIYSVHRATAARWVAQAREALVDRIRHALQLRLGLEPHELDSLVHAILSQLEISFGLLQTPDPDVRSSTPPTPAGRNSDSR